MVRSARVGALGALDACWSVLERVGACWSVLVDGAVFWSVLVDGGAFRAWGCQRASGGHAAAPENYQRSKLAQCLSLSDP